VSERLYLGADPGKSGGLVLLDEAGAVVNASAMPDTEHDLVDHLAEFAGRIHIAHVEAVHSFPDQGLASSFNFGMSYGGLRMALVALRIPFEAISPQRWQRLIGVPIVQKKNKKKATRAKAQELFPNCKWTHATADAALLAEHARRIYCGLKAPRRTDQILPEAPIMRQGVMR